MHLAFVVMIVCQETYSCNDCVRLQIEDVDDERRNAERVTLAMRENLVQPGCSAQSSAFQMDSTGFPSTSVSRRFICGSFC